jgi:hypothetical protein
MGPLLSLLKLCVVLIHVGLGLHPRDVSRQIFGTTWQDLLMLNRNMCVRRWVRAFGHLLLRGLC